MSEQNDTPPAGSRPIDGFPGYRICDGGQVWSNHRQSGGIAPWHTVKPFASSKDGRLQVKMYVDGRRRLPIVSRLVLQTFVGPCPLGLECCHNDGDATNNFVYNLRWDTKKNNAADTKRHGRAGIGERNRAAKLREKDIVDIFRLSREGFSRLEIARKYGVTPNNICKILNRDNWSHVPIPIKAKRPC